MNKSCTKFRQRNLNIIIAILKGLRDGLYPSLIARKLGLKRNLIHYYVKKFAELRFIEKRESVMRNAVRTRGAITVYRLTGNGSKFLAGIERQVYCRRLRLHNCYWLYPIVEQPRIEIDWRKHNWGQLIGRELGLTVRKNPNSVEVVTSVLYGDDAYEAFKDEERMRYELSEEIITKCIRLTAGLTDEEKALVKQYNKAARFFDSELLMNGAEKGWWPGHTREELQELRLLYSQLMAKYGERSHE